MNYKNTLLQYGVDLLEYNYNYILSQLQNDNAKKYNLDKLIFDIFEIVDLEGTLTFDKNKAKKELLENYDLNEIYNILESLGYDPKNISDEKIHLILTKYETEKYIKQKYLAIKEMFKPHNISDNMMLLATIYDIGKTHNLCFIKNISDPMYEKIIKIAIDNNIWDNDYILFGFGNNTKLLKYIIDKRER